MEKIFQELQDKNQPERWTRVIALEKFGKPAVDYLHKALDDEDKWCGTWQRMLWEISGMFAQ